VTQPAFYDRYRERFARTWTDGTPLADVRFVILDSETTGLNPRVDRLITIGAVAVQNGEIVLDDGFEAMIRVDENTSAVTVHGVTRDQSRGGRDEAEVLEAFLAYLGDGVIVGHHIDHDIITFDTACERRWGFRMSNRSLDTMDLTLHLEKDGAFAGRPPIRRYTLDALCEMIWVLPQDRLTARGDALKTAQVFLRLLRLASRHGRDTLGRLSEPFLEPA
jgi:DNA polymerase-3 subunit epsilon